MLLPTVLVLLRISSANFDAPVKVTPKQALLFKREATAVRQNAGKTQELMMELERKKEDFASLKLALDRSIADASDKVKTVQASFQELAPGELRDYQVRAAEIFFGDIVRRYASRREQNRILERRFSAAATWE